MEAFEQPSGIQPVVFFRKNEIMKRHNPSKDLKKV